MEKSEGYGLSSADRDSLEMLNMLIESCPLTFQFPSPAASALMARV